MSQRNLYTGITETAARIRLLVLDVDGVLTDGSLHYGPEGFEWKTFHVRDGLGIKLAQRAGIEVAIISGRGGGAVEQRVKELGIRHIRLKRDDKEAALEEIAEELRIGLSAVAAVGDDTPDLACSRFAASALRSPTPISRCSPPRTGRPRCAAAAAPCAKSVTCLSTRDPSTTTTTPERWTPELVQLTLLLIAAVASARAAAAKYR